jgi:hypothetical protein
VLTRTGPHCILSTGDALDWARHAPVVKGVNSLAALKTAPEHALRIYRHWWSEVDQDAILNARDGTRVVAAILGALAGYRHPLLHVEVLNEIHPPQRANYIALLEDVVPRLHVAGVKVAGPSFSTGDYEQADWEAFRAARWCGLDAIALHAYWGNQGFTIWHALRWRQWWDRARDPNLILVTECGRDRVEGGAGGYRADGVSEDVYIAELIQYDAEIAKDGSVYGTPFSAGPTPDWRNFDTDPLSGRLVAMTSAPTAAPGPFAVPAPPKEPDPVVTPANPVELLGDANPWRGKILCVHECPADPGVLIRTGQILGLRGFELKVADGDSSWVDSPRRFVSRWYADRLREAGFAVLSWSYNYCDGRVNAGDRGDGLPVLEAKAAVLAAQAIGSEAHTFDLEAECEGHPVNVAVMLDVARYGGPSGAGRVPPIGIPIAAHVWGALEGHESYPYDAICQRVDILRPMIYRPVWDAEEFWASWSRFVPGFAVTWHRFVCPVWGITEGTAEGIAVDQAVADAHECPGEGYWEEDAALVVATSAQAHRVAVRNLIVERRFPGEVVPGPDPNVAATLDRCWGATLDLAAAGNEAAAVVIQRHLVDAKVDLGLQDAA